MQSRGKELLVMNVCLEGRTARWNLSPPSSQRQKSSSLGHWVVYAAHRVNTDSIWTLVSFRATLGQSYLYDTLHIHEQFEISLYEVRGHDNNKSAQK